MRFLRKINRNHWRQANFMFSAKLKIYNPYLGIFMPSFGLQSETQIMDRKALVEKSHFFHQILISKPNFTMKFSKFQPCNLQLITFPKRYFASKSTYKLLRYDQKKVEKRVFPAKIE